MYVWMDGGLYLSSIGMSCLMVVSGSLFWIYLFHTMIDLCAWSKNCSYEMGLFGFGGIVLKKVGLF